MIDATLYCDDFVIDMAPILAESYRHWYPFCRETVMETINRVGSPEFLECALGVELPSQAVEVLRDAWLEPYRSYHTRSGKMLRPFLVCFVIEALGGDPTKLPIPIAIAELIHAASLILDDIADDSLLRRGGSTAHRTVGLRVAGATASAWLNVCFELLARHDSVLDSGLGSVATTRLVEEIAWEHWVTGIGTTVDTTWPWMERFDGTAEQYLQSVIHRSTSYTCRLPLKIGAIAGGANTRQTTQLAAFGEELGLAFQIVDDILNVKPGDDKWGKAIAEDITQGKINLQVLIALERLNSGRSQRLTEILKIRTTDTVVLREAIQLLAESGAFDVAREAALTHVSHCKELCSDMTFLSNQSRDVLADFVDYVIRRSR
jgi:geranylgeranyl diphosphate synthase type I/geranylgeranyl diphosphate synthase type II